MKKSILFVSTVLSSLLTCSVAFADAKTGLVVGGQVGYAKPNVNFNSTSSSDVSRGNLIYGATLGFDVAIMPHYSFGVESGALYSNKLSKIKSSGDTDKVSNLIIPVLGVLKVYTYSGFNFFVKGGGAYVSPSSSKTGSSYHIDWKSDWELAAAVGLGYQIGSFNIFAQYMHIFGKDDVTVNSGKGTGYSSKINSMTAGVEYIFG